ncbi:MAG: zinc ribbon domain-containing protein [Clostridia bacterium]|nr:zinc ribbon domain-containing protein [Clostridia bacterium]
MKQQLIYEISSKLSALGIQVQNGIGCDISINTEFLDAGWSTGNKKITYEACVFANEQDNVVYMYEKTTETGHGLSFGGDSGTSFQSGKTLFRKVKSVQYGLDGKAYEYTLDLGAIPKTVKETAKLYGWKFKTVINKSKAIYPPGYVPPFAPTAQQAPQAGHSYCSNCGMPLMENAAFCDKCGKPAAFPQQSYPHAAQNFAGPELQQPSQPQYNNPQEQFYSHVPQKSNDKASVIALIAFISLGIFSVIMLAAVKSTPLGWALSAIILAASFFIQRKLNQKGCLVNIILWVITGIVLFVVMALTSTDTGNNTSSVPSSGTSTSSQASAEKSDSAAFRIDRLSYELWPESTFRSDNSAASDLSVAGDITIDLVANPKSFSGPADKVAKINAAVSILKPPSYGTVKLYRFIKDKAGAPNTPTLMKKFGLPMNFEIPVTENFSDSEKPENYLISFNNSSNYGQIRIFYCIENLLPIDLSLPDWKDNISAAVSKGITSDALRSKVGIELVMTMKSGEKHRIYFERELMKGDFFSKTRLEGIEENFQGKQPPIFSTKIN